MAFENIAVLGTYNEDQREINRQITSRLESAGIFEEDPEKADALIVVGGDGTYLSTMKELDYPDTPTIGVNAGHLGYFQEIVPDRIDDLVETLQAGRYEVVDRSLLAVRNVGEKAVHHALNEIAITPENRYRALKGILTVGSGRFGLFVGDGLLVASPHGSSGWAVHHGGAFIADGLKAFQVVTMGAADSTQYESVRAPLVIPEETVVRFDPLETDWRPVEIGADGERIEGLDETKPIEITKSSKTLKVIRTLEYDFYDRLAKTMINRKQS